MTEDKNNPYASPLAEEELPAFSHETYRDANRVVTGQCSVLPKRCWLCGKQGLHKRELSATGWISTSGMGNVAVHCWVCDAHRNSLNLRVMYRLVAYTIIPAIGIAVGIAIGAAFRSPTPFFLCLLLTLVACVYASIRIDVWAGRPPEISRIKSGAVWLRGAGQPFLDSLPDRPVESLSDDT